MLNEGIKNLKSKLKEDKKNYNCTLISVRQASNKELFKQFNALNEDEFFTNKEASTWQEELVGLMEEIQIRTAKKESLQYAEREKMKTDKKSVEEILGKITICPLKDAEDYSIRAFRVQNIKFQTASMDPDKRKPRLKHLIIESM